MRKITLLLSFLGAIIFSGSAQISTTSMVWKWDTIICFNDQEAVIERFTQSFDNSGRALSQLIEVKSGSNWVNKTSYKFTYDNNGRLIASLAELWQAGAWVSINRIGVTYNGLGMINMELSERWQNGNWANNFKRTYAYDLSGRKLWMLQEKWVAGAWENDMKSTYSYNANVNTIIVEYTEDGNVWIKGGRLTYTCEPNGNYIELMLENWENAQWEKDAKIDFTNDADGNILAETEKSPFGNGWVNESKKSYTYDQYGNALSGKTEQWSAGTWLPDEQTSYLYYKRDYLQVLDVPVYRYEASYRGFPLGMEDEKPVRFSIYPNPATEFVVIESSIKNSDSPVSNIYDSSGHLLKTMRLIENQTKIDLTGLSAGLYLLNIGTNEGIATRKLIIK
jgi:hypothetical protein